MLHDLEALWNDPLFWQPPTLQKYGFDSHYTTVFPYETPETKQVQKTMYTCLDSILPKELTNIIEEYAQACYCFQPEDVNTDVILNEIANSFLDSDAYVKEMNQKLANGLRSYLDHHLASYCQYQSFIFTLASYCQHQSFIFTLIKHYQMDAFIYLLGSITRLNTFVANETVRGALCQLQLQKCNVVKCDFCYFFIRNN